MENEEIKQEKPIKAPPKVMPPKRPIPAKPIKEDPKVIEKETSEPEKQTQKGTQKIKDNKKEPKPKKIKKRIGKKKLLIILLSIILVLAVAGVSVYFIFFNKKHDLSLTTPTLQVVKLENSVHLKSSKVNNAVEYEFVLTDDKGVTTNYFSNTGEYELKKIANQPGEYNFKVRAYNKVNGKSGFSEIKTIKNTVQISSPKIEILGLDEIVDKEKVVGYKTNQNLEDDYLSWPKVDRAVSYLISYGVDYSGSQPTIKTYKYTPQQTSAIIRFELSTLYNLGGANLYRISVVAVPAEGGYYVNSDYALAKDIFYYKNLSKPQNATFTRSTKELIFNFLEEQNYSDEYNLIVSSEGVNKTYTIYTSELNKTTNANKSVTFSINLSDLLKDLDITSLKLQTASSDNYVINSEYTNVDIKNWILNLNKRHTTKKGELVVCLFYVKK